MEQWNKLSPEWSQWLDGGIKNLEASAPQMIAVSPKKRGGLQEVLAYVRECGYFPTRFKQGVSGSGGGLVVINPSERQDKEGKETQVYARTVINPVWRERYSGVYEFVRDSLLLPEPWPGCCPFPPSSEAEGSLFYIQLEGEFWPTSLQEITERGRVYTLHSQHPCIEEMLQTAEDERFTKQSVMKQTLCRGDHAHMLIYPEEGILPAVLDSVHDRSKGLGVFRLHTPPDNLMGEVAFFDPQLSPSYNKWLNKQRERYSA